MQVANPMIAAEIATADKPTPFQSPVSGQAESSPENHEDHLDMLVRYFEESEDMTSRARKLSERDRDYHDNFDDDQWTTAEKAALRKRGQPVTTSNYIKRKVATLKGGEMRMRSDPKAFPRNPQDENDADIATQALRYIGDQNAFNVTRSKVYENFLIEGYGGADVVAEDSAKSEKKIKIIRVPWDRLFFDPHSSAEDFGDAAYKGVVIWRDAKKGDQDVLGETLRSSYSNTYDDRPKTSWVDSRRTRVRVVQIHYLHEGEWWVATFTKAGFMPDGKPMVSPYMDEDGKPACSLVLRSAYVDRENNRFGAVRDWISTQEEINKRRSKGIHLINSRQTFGNKQAITDATEAKSQLAKPDGHVELNGGAEFGKDFGMIPTADMARGNFEMLQNAVHEMQSSGPNAAMAGKAPGQQSGRALEQQRDAGAIEMEPLADGLRQWTRDVYKAAWCRARQFWTGPVWIRVTDDNKSVRFVGLNKQVTLEEKLKEIAQEQGIEVAKHLAMQEGIQSPYDQRLKQVVETQNQIGELDVDIEVEEGPDISTLQSEQFETLSGLAKAGLPIPARAIVEASSLRNKESILKAMPGGDEKDPAAAQAKQQMDQMNQELQKLSQENQQLKSDLSIKSQEADTKQYAAETDRMTAVAPAMTPQDIAAIVSRTMQEIMTQGQAPGQPQPMPQQPPMQEPPMQEMQEQPQMPPTQDMGQGPPPI